MKLKQRFRKIARWLTALFFFMLICRLIYGYVATDIIANSDHAGDFLSSVENLTIQYYSILAVSLVCISLSVFIILLIIDKLKILSTLTKTS